MGMANIDALLAEIAQIKESLRIKNQSLANINPNYQMNQAYIAKLKDEISVLNSNLATAQASLKADSTPPKIPAPAAKPDPVPKTRSEYADYISVVTPQGTLLFPDQATYDAWSNDPASVAFTSTPGGQIASIVPPSVQSSSSTLEDQSDPYVNNGNSTIQTIENAAPATIPDSQGPAVDEDGNLLPGWMYEPESGQYVYVGGDYVSPSTQASAAESRAAYATSSANGITGPLQETRGQASSQDQANTRALGDWRVRLRLAPNANYLYAGPNPGILAPLKQTNGIIFPYTPSISVNYAANYGPTDVTHSNYKIYQYTSSGVDNINITCTFTAQDIADANYMLAVIHFFKSVTKMFYGQDQNPVNGTPPPLCYLTGLGAFQFNNHPLVITSFNYTLPTEVDYIQTGNADLLAGVNRQQTGNDSVTRYNQALIDTGGRPPPPAWRNIPTGSVEPTYVPTSISLSVSALPIVSRNDISRAFSLKKYATGELLQGSKRDGGGIW